jgi:two-component sensor histidine kinase
VTKSPPINDPLVDPKNGHILTRAIIDTIHDPLIVLDEKLCVIVASKSFYTKFKVKPIVTQHHLFYELGNGEWDIPALRTLLKKVISQHTTIENYEVEHDFKTLGKRIMLVNAREIVYENGGKKMLLSIFDVTEERAREAELQDLVQQKNNLLNEMRHRIANSLQLIASILMLKAATVASEEARLHLENAHERIMSIATVQGQLDPAGLDGLIVIGPYLEALCASLAKSMIGGRKPITLKVDANPDTATPDEAVSFGLLVTELIINSLKHAFPSGEGAITVTYKSKKPAWSLVVADNGVGYDATKNVQQGLGTSIVDSIASQLQATLTRKSDSSGTIVSLVHS